MKRITFFISDDFYEELIDLKKQILEFEGLSRSGMYKRVFEKGVEVIKKGEK